MRMSLKGEKPLSVHQEISGPPLAGSANSVAFKGFSNLQ